MIRSLVGCALLALFGLPRPGGAATIILVRHAERAGGMAADVPLSPQGVERAKQLARILRDANIRAIYTTEVRRTKQTAEPVAEKFHLTPVEIAAKDADGLVSRLRALRDDETALVVGHTSNLPIVIEKLGGGAVAAYGENEYDRMIVLETGKEKTRVLTLRYGDAP